jgi:hypothetical protein
VRPSASKTGFRTSGAGVIQRTTIATAPRTAKGRISLMAALSVRCSAISKHSITAGGPDRDGVRYPAEEIFASLLTTE